MKKIIFIVVLFTLGLAFSYLLSRKDSALPEPPETTKPATTPVLPPSRTDKDIAYNVSAGFTAPEIMPALEASGPLDSNLVSLKVAGLLGFTESPVQINGTRGAYTSWSQGNKSLILTPDNHVLTYISGALPKTILTPDESAFRSVAGEYFTSLFPAAGLHALVPESVKYFAPENTDARQVPSIGQATVIQVNLAYKSGPYTIYADGAGFKPGAYIQFNSEKEVLRFSITLFPSFKDSGSGVSIVSYETAVERLMSSQGVLVNYAWDVPGDEPTLLSSPPSSITVTRGSLAYYYDRTQNAVAPVYILTGMGYIDKNQSVSTVTVVHAL